MADWSASALPDIGRIFGQPASRPLRSSCRTARQAFERGHEDRRRIREERSKLRRRALFQLPPATMNGFGDVDADLQCVPSVLQTRGIVRKPPIRSLATRVRFGRSPRDQGALRNEGDGQSGQWRSMKEAPLALIQSPVGDGRTAQIAVVPDCVANVPYRPIADSRRST